MSTPDECAQEILDVIPSVMRFIRAEMRSHRAPGLSIPQFRALRRVSKNPGCSLGELANHLGLTPATTSSLVEGLVQRSLIARVSSTGDRRRVTLDLTTGGRNAMEETMEKTQEAIRQAISKLSTSGLMRIRRAVPALRAAFDVPPAAPVDEARG